MPKQHGEVSTWRHCHDEAKRRQDDAQRALQEATRDRARALMEGIAELGGPPPDYRGGQAAVARELNTTRQTISQILKAYRTTQPHPVSKETTP